MALVCSLKHKKPVCDRCQRRIQVLGGGGGHGWWVWLGVGSASGPIRKAGGGGGVLSVYGPIRGAGGGGGCCRFMARYEERGGGGGGGAVRFWPKTKSGGGGGGCCWFLARYEGRGGGEYDRVSGGPGYSTVVEFMRADINRQRNRAAIL